jgi:broad specificity polyphosphatase/5'/3'-nucleotidase SurE
VDAFPRAASFVVKLLRELEISRAEKAPLLPPDLLLNVNYPGLPEPSIKGVRLARVARTGGFKARFVATDKPGLVRIDLEHADASGDPVQDADAVLFAEGYVTISVLDARLDASRQNRKLLREQLRGILTPAVSTP